MKKRFCSVLLASLLAVPAAVPQYPMMILAEETAEAPADEAKLLYSSNTETTVSSGSNAIVLGEEDTAKFANLTDMTLETTFTTTSTTLQTVMFVGNKDTQYHYISVYINPAQNKVGMESMLASGNYAFHKSTTVSNVDWNSDIKLKVELKAKEKLVITVNDTVVGEWTDITANFTKDTFTNINYVGFGNGQRTNNSAYSMSGTFKNISVYGVEPAEVETPVTPVENGLIYENKDGAQINNGTGAILPDAVDVTKFAALESMTLECNFTATGSGVESIMFIGDSTKTHHYTAVYRSGNKLGLEIQSANGTRPYKHVNFTLSNVDFSKNHLLAVTFDTAANKVAFYLDGEKVHEETVEDVNFVKDVLSNVNYVGFGKGNRGSNGSNAYPLTGSISDIKVFNYAKTAEEVKKDQLGNIETVVYKTDSVFNTQTKAEPVTDAEAIENIKALTEGTWSTRFRTEGIAQGQQIAYLSAVSDGEAARDFVAQYIKKENNGSWTVGIDAPGKTISAFTGLDASIDLADGAWHDFTAVRSGNTWKFYVDGDKAGEATSTGTGLFDAITNPNALAVGYAKREATQNANALNGSVENVTIYSGQFNDTEAKLASSILEYSGVEKTDLTNAELSDKMTLFNVGYDGSAAYRIPSLITTDKGTVLAGIDKRNSGFADQGNIDFAVKRKELGDTEFGEPIIISDMLSGGSGRKSAVMIDSVLLQDTDPNSAHKGRIHAIVDMFTQSNAAMELGNQAVGNEYIKIGENSYRKVYKDGETQPYAVVEEDGVGIVYSTTTTNGVNALGEKTAYTVTLHAPAPYTQIGNLYKDGVYKGNIFMNEDGPDKGELHMKKTMSIWHFYSDDDGKTWSEPTDLSPQIKADWMQFCGTGPGRGVQLQNGRLVFPIYTCNSSGLASQASALIVSDDWGETWVTKPSPNTLDGLDRETMRGGTIYTESQPIQLRNGDVLLFMRTQSGKVKYAVSKDNGESWASMHTTNIPAVYCQYTVITYVDKNDNEYVLVANPSGPARENGIVTRGKVLEDGSIEWDTDNTKLIEPTGYAYSCLTEIEPAEDGTKRFGLFYELNNDPISMEYVTFDENYLTATDKPIEEFAPEAVTVKAELIPTVTRAAGQGIRVTLTADQTILKAGDVAMTVKCGNTNVDLPAVSATNSTVVFEGNLPADYVGLVSVEALKTTDGELTNINGLPLSVEKQDLLDSSVVTPVAIDSYSTQHSASTAEGADGAAVNIIDGNENTYWHSRYGAGDTMPQWVVMDLGEAKEIDQMNFLNRKSSNNAICKEFKIEVSTDKTNWTTVAESTMANTQKWQNIPFEKATARYVKFTEKSNYSDNAWATIAEINFNLAVEGIDRTSDTTHLNKLIKDLEALEEGKTAASWATFNNTLTAAKALAADASASQGAVDAMIQTLRDGSRALAIKTDLAEDIADYKKLNEADYTPETWSAFKTYLDATETGLEQIETQRDIDAHIMMLHSLASKLVEAETPITPDPETVDKSVLQAACDKADTLKNKAADYESTKFAAFQTSAAAGKTVLNDADATQEEVDNAAKALNQALLAMRLIPSDAKLEALK